jgi:hypothetical protein
VVNEPRRGVSFSAPSKKLQNDRLARIPASEAGIQG